MSKAFDWTNDVLHGADPEIKNFIKALGLESDKVYRIVLDVAADKVATVYVEMYGSRKALKVLTEGPKAPEIQIIDKAPDK